MTSLLRWLFLGWACFHMTVAIGFAQQSELPVAVEAWIEDLGHDQYLRREKASRQLTKIGSPAIAPLVAAIANGDLEVTERAMDVITEIGLSKDPGEDGGAWDQLSQMASKGSGQTASRAESALAEIRADRSRKARIALNAAGVFVGYENHFTLTTGQQRLAVRIDDQWNGDTEALLWLRWLDGIENALIQGTAGNREVLQHVVTIPGLTAIAIADAKIDLETLKPLKDLTRISSLEFWYVELQDSWADLIASLPIRSRLDLMGTGISSEAVESMRQSLSGLVITHRQGGFLGVKCQTTIDNESNSICEIFEVVQGSPAHQAGLLPGDSIVQIGQAKVNSMDDLLDGVGQHTAGEMVEVGIRRAGQLKTLQATLGRFLQK